MAVHTYKHLTPSGVKKELLFLTLLEGIRRPPHADNRDLDRSNQPFKWLAGVRVRYGKVVEADREVTFFD